MLQLKWESIQIQYQYCTDVIIQPGNSIIAAWISPDNHYAFIDFRNGDEAAKGFALNSVSIHGQVYYNNLLTFKALKVGRPRSYQETQPFMNPLTALLGAVGN